MRRQLAVTFTSITCPHILDSACVSGVRSPSTAALPTNISSLPKRCASCSRPLDKIWAICPYCEAEVPGFGARRTRRRRPPAPQESEHQESFPTRPERAQTHAGERAQAAETGMHGRLIDDDRPELAAASEPPESPRRSAIDEVRPAPRATPEQLIRPRPAR